MPAIAPLAKVAKVPETMERGASATISARRSGAIAVMPPIMIPTLPKLAKPHNA